MQVSEILYGQTVVAEGLLEVLVWCVWGGGGRGEGLGKAAYRHAGVAEQDGALQPRAAAQLVALERARCGVRCGEHEGEEDCEREMVHTSSMVERLGRGRHVGRGSARPSVVGRGRGNVRKADELCW